MSDLTLEQQTATVIQRGFGGFTFDAIFEEDHTVEMEVTDSPVETGVSVTDHAFMKPYKVKLTVGVTNHQLRPYDGGFGLGDERIQNAFRKLTDLMLTREPFDLQTGLKLYTSMICTYLRVIQNASASSSLVFECDIREIVIVNTEVVTYPPRQKGAATNQASKKKASGEKQSKEVEAPKQKTSLAKGLKNALGRP